MAKINLGSWITLSHFSIPEILSQAKFDWLCVDMEHSVIDYLEAEHLIATIQSNGIKAYVRVGENNARIIKRVLDAGADGLIIPMVNTRKDAENAVAYAKYPPKGNRGVGLARAQKYGLSFEEYASTINDQIKIIAQIEHIDAIKNLEEILSVKGIDGTIIGPYDLSGSMGKPGQYNEPDVQQVLEKYKAISRNMNKMMGYHVIEPDFKEVLKKVDEGYEFIAFSLDTMFLGRKCLDEVQSLRKELK